MIASTDMSTAPSPWVLRHAALVPAGGTVLDLAAGGGRHSRVFLGRGHKVIAVDRDIAALGALTGQGLEIIRADLEAEPWPLAGRRFAGIIVTNYLWRPLLPLLVQSLEPAGALIYETFACGNERFGKPSNPDFLLRPGELLEAVRFRLHVVAYEHGEIVEPRQAVIQRIAAVIPPED